MNTIKFGGLMSYIKIDKCLNLLHKVEDQGINSLNEKEQNQLIYSMTELIKLLNYNEGSVTND
jgi:hypothetical protein